MPNIKLELHELIDRIDDNKVLEAVYTLLSRQPVSFTIEGQPLSQEAYTVMLAEGEDDITLGKVHDHEAVKDYFKQKANG